MAVKKAETEEVKTMDKTEETVKIKLFRDNGKYSHDVFVSVNGKNYQIQRGVEVEVPAYVAEVLEHSAMQDKLAADTVQKLENATR